MDHCSFHTKYTHGCAACHKANGSESSLQPATEEEPQSAVTTEEHEPESADEDTVLEDEEL